MPSADRRDKLDGPSRVARQVRGWGPEAASAALAIFAAWRVADGSFRAGFPVDDAWIHMVYGLAVRNGEGLAYNTRVASTGCTSPLWSMFAALAHLLSGSHEPSMAAAATLKGLGVAMFAATAALAARLSRATSARRSVSPAAALAAGVVVASTPILAFASVSGMEVCLTSAMLLGAILLAVRHRAVAAGVVAGLAASARPEAVLAVPAVCAIAAWSPLRPARAARSAPWWRPPAVTAASASVPVAALVLRTLAVSGRPLPATFYHKGHFVPRTFVLDMRMGFVEFLGTLPPTSFVLLWVLALCAVGLFVSSVVRYRGGRGRMLRTRQVAPAVAAVLGVAYVAGMAVATALLAPRVFYFQRYVIPPIPLFVVSAVSAASWLAAGPSRIGARAPHGWGRRIARAAALASFAAFVVFEVRGWGAEREHYRSDVLDIDTVQVALGHFLARAVPPDGVVWSQDAGAIRYWGRRKTLDLYQLNTPDVIQGGKVDPSWSPDTITYAWGLVQVLAPKGVLDQVAEFHAPSAPDSPLGIQIALRCTVPPKGDSDRRLLVERKSGAKIVMGTCARADGP